MMHRCAVQLRHLLFVPSVLEDQLFVSTLQVCFNVAYILGNAGQRRASRAAGALSLGSTSRQRSLSVQRIQKKVTIVQ